MAGQTQAVPGRWSDHGATGEAVWGACQGSGKTPYHAVVELAAPAFKCTCPSRKVPCKHVLGLLLLWSAGEVPDAAAPAGFATEWLDARADRAAKAAARVASGGRTAPGASESRVARVTAGLDELDRWLRDQVSSGLAGLSAGTVAQRLVDAQAPGAAAAVHRLLGTAAGDPGTLLRQVALLHLLVRAHRRLDTLEPALAATVRSRVGYPVTRDEVLATAPVRDRWVVLARRNAVAGSDGRLQESRVWLAGSSGRVALVLTFAPAGQALGTDLEVGTGIDADLHFYPGAQPLRALVGARHGEPGPPPPVPGHSVTGALGAFAAALAADPWTERWPVLLDAVTPVITATGWQVADEAGDALPLTAAPDPGWMLLALGGGRPVTLFAECSEAGLTPLAARTPDDLLVAL
jgi:hypothetical protein